MKKILFSIVILSATVVTSHGQTVLSYQQAPNLGGEDFINQAVGGNSTDAYAVGSSDATGTAGGYDMFLANFDPNDGTVMWAKQYGSTATDYGTRVLNDGSGNILVVGRTNAFSANGNNDFALVQVNAATGAINWSKAIGTDTIDVPFAVKASNDGGYIIGGYTQPGQRSSMYLMKVQTDGTVDWTRTIGSQFGNERMYDIKALGSGEGYLLVGYTGIYGSVLNEAMFALVADDGSLQAAFTFGGSGDDDARKFVDGTGGFFIAGNTRSYGVGVQDIFLAKFTFNQITELPELAWLKTYGGSQSEDFMDMMTISDDGLVLLLAHTNSFGVNGESLLLAVSETDGEVLLSYTYGGSGDDWLGSMLGTDAGLVLAGYSSSYSSGNDGYLVKLGQDGSSGCNDQTQTISAVDQTSNVTVVGPPTNSTDFTSVVTTADVNQSTSFSTNDLTGAANELCLTTNVEENVVESDFEAYPVPTTGELTVKLNLPVSAQALIEVLSVEGKIVLTQITTSNLVAVDCSALDTGLYFIRVSGDSSLATRSFIKK